MSFTSLIKYKLAKKKWQFKNKLKKPYIPNETELNVIYIVSSLIKDEKSTMLIAPISGKKYIQNKSRNMFIILNDLEITISNNVAMYYYNLKVDLSVSNKLSRHFNNVLESRRAKMETETVAGVTSNLDFIAKHINDCV
jgi:hypothetical protein